MSCKVTEACKYRHCTDCPNHETGNLTTGKDSSDISKEQVSEILRDFLLLLAEKGLKTVYNEGSDVEDTVLHFRKVDVEESLRIMRERYK